MHRVSESGLDQKPAIVFADVSKSFQIKHTQSLKEAFIALVRRKERSSHFNAVDHVSFEVPQGQSVALMGRNGSGKSTTLKLLSGVMAPDAGWIRTRGRTAGLLELGAGFHPDLTGRENVYLNAAILGMSKEETEERFERILEFSEIGDFIDTEVKRYSSGMYSRLGFSVAVHTELDTLLVDEVLSVGDAQFREKCNLKMLELQEQGKTMFIVSHNYAQVRELCERGIVLEQGRIAFDGPIEEAVAFLQQPTTKLNEELLSQFPIRGGIRNKWIKAPDRYGAPIGYETVVTENGGGWFQQFENGYITFSKAFGKGYGLLSGELLTEYLALGGARSRWGFLAEDSDNENGGNVRSLTFQHGKVVKHPDKGFILRPFAE